MANTEVPFRILPELNDTSGFFWKSGEDGQLRFLRCGECGTRLHPPQPMCYVEHSKNLAPEPVSGRGRVHSFSINYQPWMPGPELPFVVAIVEIEEDPRVRLTTNIVGCAPEDVAVGMPVRVTFEHHSDEGGDVWLPLFEPDPDADANSKSDAATRKGE
ncbi:Zn-ribbon domain-containing OB-fold protein [Myxococcota bacterium]|nr:Zn-ribbon domain-containing OB-fold protein [Myxococcota bacterium]